MSSQPNSLPSAALSTQPEQPPFSFDSDGAARLAGSRVTVDTFVAVYKGGATVQEIAESFPSLLLADIHAMIAYYLRHTAEVESYLHQRKVEAEKIRQHIEPLHSPVGLRERLTKRSASQK